MRRPTCSLHSRPYCPRCPTETQRPLAHKHLKHNVFIGYTWKCHNAHIRYMYPENFGFFSKEDEEREKESKEEENRQEKKKQRKSRTGLWPTTQHKNRNKACIVLTHHAHRALKHYIV